MRLTRWLFIFFAVYAVFIGGGPYYYTIFPVRLLHHLVLTVVLAGWLARRLRDGLPRTPLNLALFAAVGVWALSAVFSADPRMAVENLWFPFVHLLIFFVLADLFQRGRQRLVMETVFMLGALVVCMALLQFGSWLFGWGIVPGTETGWLSALSAEMPLPPVTPMIYLPLGVSTWLAGYAAPNVLLAFGWSLTARQRDFRIVLRLLAAALLLVLILTFSRGGFISLGAGAALFIVLRASQSAAVRQLNLQRAAARLVPVGLILVVVAVIVFTIGQSSSRYSGDALRLNLWRSAVSIAKDHPVLGIGPGLFGRGARLYRDASYVDDRLGTAHSILLNTAAEDGLAGLLVLGVLAALVLRAWWRLWSKTDSPGRKLRLEIALAALVGMSAQCLFDTFTTTPLVGIIALLVVYCTVEPRSAFSLRPEGAGERVRQSRGSRLVAGAALALVLAYGAFWIQSDRAQAAFNRSVREGDIDAAREAAGIDPALHLYQLQIAYLTGVKTLPDDDPSAATAAYQRALELEPTWDTGWLNLSALQERAGELDSALASLERAEDINANNAAAFHGARLAETHHTAPDNEIVQMYVEAMPSIGLPLSDWWTETDVRRQAVESYYQSLSASPDLQYRIAFAHFPERLAGLVPDDPQTAAEWWVRGEYALSIEHDAAAAVDAFTQALALSRTMGDYYAVRARAVALLGGTLPARDLNLARLLGTSYESVNAIRASLAIGAERERLLAAAIPPRVIDQNFEGVQFGGRTASFELLPEMRAPGPGRATMQPWYDLAALYEADGRIEQAQNVYRAILDYAPGEQLARERLAAFAGG
jgi:O-antigen ligase